MTRAYRSCYVPVEPASLRPTYGGWPAAHPEPRLQPSDDPWLRWTRTDDAVHAVIDMSGEVRLADPDGILDETSARIGDRPISAERVDGAILVDVADAATPVAISFRPRH